MAQTIAQIQQEIIDTIQADTVLAPQLSSPSKTAIWRLISYVSAVASWLNQNLFDKHIAEVDDKLLKGQKGNLYWLSEKAKEFQYGHELIPFKDTYAIIDDDAKIIAQCSVTENNDGKLIMKVAKLVNGNLAKLSDAEFIAFSAYIERIKFAGVIINKVSADADLLQLNLRIRFDPLVLTINDDGKAVLISDPAIEPAVDTIKSFIQSLSFNGEFIPVKLQDALQLTTGIDIPTILNCATKYGANDWEQIVDKVIPQAGYLNINDADLIIEYEANV